MVHMYNLFFYANACHVCKRSDEEVPLKRCGNCTMISYCTKKHQKQHWPQHKELCIAIRSVLANKKVLNIFHKSSNYEKENWAQVKMNLMLLVTIKLGRKLEHYEEEMFKFLRSCSVCHDRDATNLKDCRGCPSASICSKHMNDPLHKETCRLLRLCFNLDVSLMTHEPKGPEMKVPHVINELSLPKNMRNFIDLYIKSQKSSHLSAEEEISLNSEYLTRPLTLLYAIQKLGYLSRDGNITVHVVGANMIEVNGIETWEILLHYLPNVTSVKIILVGPELTSGCIPCIVCKDCVLKNKQLFVEMYDNLYNDCANDSSFSKPDLIIGYNAGIHECEEPKSIRDTWASSLLTIAKQNCPFILTSYTSQEMEKEQNRLKTVLGNGIKYAHFSSNPYSSLRPYRDFETEGVYYQNQYIIIYKNLTSL